MLVITEAQLERLSRLDRAVIVRKTLAVLRQRDTRLARRDEYQAASILIAQAVSRAVDVLGCRTESCAADYAGLVYAYGFGFEKDPKVAAILARNGVGIEARLHSVFHELSGEDWQRLQTGSAPHRECD